MPRQPSVCHALAVHSIRSNALDRKAPLNQNGDQSESGKRCKKAIASARRFKGHYSAAEFIAATLYHPKENKHSIVHRLFPILRSFSYPFPMSFVGND